MLGGERFLRLCSIPSILGLVIVGSSRADAQSATRTDPSPSLRLGNLNITPTVLLTSGYDSNINRESPPLSAQETFALPQLDASFRTGRFLINGICTQEITHYSGDENVGAVNWRLEGSVEYVDALFRPFFRYSRPRTNARPTGFEVGRLSKHLEDNFSSGFTLAVSPRTTIQAKYDKGLVGWAADAIYATSSLRETLNRRSNNVSGSLVYALTPITNVGFAAMLGRDRFIYSPARDANSFKTTATIDFASPAPIIGSASFGFLHFRSPHLVAADFDGMIAAVGLSYSRPSGATVHVGFDRNLMFSYDASRAYYILRNLDGSFTRPFFTNWRVLAFAGRHNLRYPARLTQAESPKVMIEGGGAIAYQLASWTRTGFSIDGFRQNGSTEYSGIRVVTFIQYGVGHLRRLDRPIPFER